MKLWMCLPFLCSVAAFFFAERRAVEFACGWFFASAALLIATKYFTEWLR